MTEHEIQNEILRAYGTRSDMRLWRANVGAARFENKLVRFGVPGQADLSGILPGGIRVEIEVKDARGRQSVEQRSWQAMIERFGGVYVLARSVADVDAALAPYLNGKKAETTSRADASMPPVWAIVQPGARGRELGSVDP